MSRVNWPRKQSFWPPSAESLIDFMIFTPAALGVLVLCQVGHMHGNVIGYSVCPSAALPGF